MLWRKRKEIGDGEYIVLQFFCSSNSLVFFIKDNSVFRFNIVNQLPGLSSVDDNPERKEEGGLIYR